MAKPSDREYELTATVIAQQKTINEQINKLVIAKQNEIAYVSEIGSLKAQLATALADPIKATSGRKSRVGSLEKPRTIMEAQRGSVPIAL